MAKDINDKVRKNLSTRVDKGKEFQEYNEARSQLMEVLSEQRRGLDERRAFAANEAQQNQLMTQAANIGVSSGPGNFNPATMELLQQYGLGQPRVQTTSNSSTRISPQNVNVTNNTTNSTVNNVQVSGSGGGAGGGNDAKFKTWISNMTASQNELAMRREKEYQRRDWELTRSTNKLMDRIDDIGNDLHERTDPEKTTGALITGLKSVLLLLGFGYLMKNMKSVGDFLGNMAGYFGVEKGSEFNTNSFLNSKFVSSIRSVFTGGKGDNNGETIASSIVSGITTAIGSLAAPLAKSIGDVFRSFMSERAEALKSIDFPPISTNDLEGSLKSIGTYLGDILKVLAGGKDAISEVQGNQRKNKASFDSFRNDDLAEGNEGSFGNQGRTSQTNAWKVGQPGGSFWESESKAKERYTKEAAGKFGITHDGVALGALGALVKNDYGKYYDNTLREGRDIVDNKAANLSAQARLSAAGDSMLNATTDDYGKIPTSKIFTSQLINLLSILKNTAGTEEGAFISNNFLNSLNIDPRSIPTANSTYFGVTPVERTDQDILLDYFINSDDAFQHGLFQSLIQKGLNFSGTLATGSGFENWLWQAGGMGNVINSEGWKYWSNSQEAKDIIKKERAKRGNNKKFDVITSNVGQESQKFYQLDSEGFNKLESEFGKLIEPYLPATVGADGKPERHKFKFDLSDPISLKAMNDYLSDIQQTKLDNYWGDNRPSALHGQVYSDFDVEALNKEISEMPAKRGKGDFQGYKFGNSAETSWKYEGKRLPVEEANQRAADVIRYFMEVHGLEEHQAKGIVANLMRESGMNEAAVSGLQNTDGSYSGATGLAQWLGENDTELEKLNNRKGFLFDAFGIKPTFEEQIRYIEHEFGLRKIPSLGEGMNGYFGMREGAWNDIKKATTAKEAFDAFLTRYEFGPDPQSSDNVYRHITKHNGYNKDGVPMGEIAREHGLKKLNSVESIDPYDLKYMSNAIMGPAMTMQDQFDYGKSSYIGELTSMTTPAYLKNTKPVNSVIKLPAPNSSFLSPFTVEVPTSSVKDFEDIYGKEIVVNGSTTNGLLAQMALTLESIRVLTAAQKNIPPSSPKKTPTPRATGSATNTADVAK